MRWLYFAVTVVTILRLKSIYAIGYNDCLTMATTTAPSDAVSYLGDCYRFNRTIQLHVTLRDISCPLIGGFLATIMSEDLHNLLDGHYTGQAHLGLEQEWNQTGLFDKWYWLGPNDLKYPLDWNASVPANVVTDGGGNNLETNGENYGALVTAGINDVGNHNLVGICQLVGPKHSYRLFRGAARMAYPIQFTMVGVPNLTACVRKCNKHLTCMSFSFSSAKQVCIEHQLLASDSRVTFDYTDSSFNVYARVDS